uniref:SGS domain-containing protein n=1 Tax=Rhabditophanes sp. KR3021 TaxID=114890 RepID=A0AC35TQF5_9BILA
MSALPKFEWYQTEKQVVISINKPDTNVCDTKFEYSGHNKLIVIANNKIIFDLTLANGIDDQKTTLTCTRKKVEVKCQKIVIMPWKKLAADTVGKEEQILQFTPLSSNVPVKKDSKNWTKIEKDAVAEEDKDLEGSEAALNKFFQSMYGGSDENTKRAMMKSYTESNGTCLSMNWDEVKKGKVECSPPDDMEFKKY